MYNVFTGETDVGDIYVERGVVKRVCRDITEKAAFTADAGGYIITPGLVDTHVHLFHDSIYFGIDPQKYILPSGVTYAIDQGTAGADNYSEFQKRVLFSTDLRYKTTLHCSRIGIPYTIDGPGELFDLNNLDRKAAVEAYRRYKDDIVGIKIRLTPNICPQNAKEALAAAVAIAEELSLPLVVHPNHAEMTSGELYSTLRGGDVVTHSFVDSHIGLIGDDGKIKECVSNARARGVIFDTGHGFTSLSFKVLRAALEQGFYPDTISTDLHQANYQGPVYDLPTTISKFLCLDVPFFDAIKMCTVNPVEIFSLKDKQLGIEEGKPADFAAFELKRGDFTYNDSFGNELRGEYKLVPVFTVLGEKLFFNRGRDA